MKSIQVRGRLIACGILLFIVAVTGTAAAQLYPGDPKPDLNIVGPTRDPGDIRDEGLKQQNEPACAIRPGDGDCIICFFNDYRTVDVLGHEDAWIGQAESCDAANSWTSRTVPGHPNHLAPIGTKFAADPRVIALPGLAIHGFIGGFRDQDSGVIAVQHWFENNKDDFDYYEPALNTIVVDEGTEGRFIDKPDFLAVLDIGAPQGSVTVSAEMENPELGTVSRELPAGTLYAAYAVFTGIQSVKLLVKTSDDWGVTWRNKTTKLTESQNLVTGITMTSMNGIVIAMWRQVLDTNDLDAVYYATTANGGQNWSKPTLLTEICKFDQPSATFSNQVTFRTNDFPWLANDGKNIYAFYTERLGGCTTGTPKVVMQHSSDGANWSTAQQVSDGPGGQFMPAAFGARGKIQVAWYDTRREAIPFNETQPFIADYIPELGVRVNRKIDVYTARITSDADGNNVQVSDAIQVNKYRAVASATDRNGPLYEIEASFANAMMYKSGFLAFVGDYFAVTAPEFRPREGGGWESNYSALPAPASNLVDFFIAYADHRDVRGDVLFGDGGITKPYTPPANTPAESGAASVDPEAPETPGEESQLLASTDKDVTRRSAEGVEDEYTDPVVNVCVRGTDADRTRDANIYGALIRDQLRLSSPVGSRPLSGILRAIPFLVNNVTDTEIGYRLFIANQPAPDPVWHRASFRQSPDRAPFPPGNDPVLTEDVTIGPNSSIARTAFVVSTDLAATVDIQIFDGACSDAADLANPSDPLAFSTACEALGSITVGGQNAAGDIRQPDYVSTVCEGDPTCANVLVTELHNPLIENPLIENPLIENPLIENPLIENMELENPLIENPLIENPLIENYGFENPLIENPLIENPLIENPLIENPLIENPLIENPLIENSALEAGVTYTDITAVIRNDGNVTTAYNVDATVSGFSTTAGGDTVSQLILWKQYVYGTSRDCAYVPEARNQVVATINQPDNELSVASIEEPFNGEGTIILSPGQQGFITYRLWGTIAELENARMNGFTTSSQAANCSEFDDEFGPPPGQEDDFYACESQIATDRELILLNLDTSGPSFDNLMNGDVIPVPAIEANAPGGACIQPVVDGLISASDQGSGVASVSCFNAEGDEICQAVGESGLSVPVSNLTIYPTPQPSPMTCVAEDTLGNSTTIDVFVDVIDDTAPLFTSFPLIPVSAVADSTGGTATVNLENGVTALDVDGVDPNPVISCSTTTGLTSAAPIPAGSYDVTCIATDASGNASDTIQYVLNVNDVTPPIVSLLGANPFLLEAGMPFVDPGATATDNVGLATGVMVDSSAILSSTIGSYPVTYTVTDTFDLSTTVTRIVTVVDTTSPDLDIPADFTVPAIPTGDNAVVPYFPTANDNASGGVTITCVPPSGSALSIGVTVVTCTATDASGNTSSASFEVEVIDVTPPVFTAVPAPIVVSASASGDAVVTYVVEAVDNSGAFPTIVCAPGPGETFPLGTTSVSCSASDAAGNVQISGFTVTVNDTTPPVVALNGDNPLQVVAGTAFTDPGATATDNVGVIGGVVVTGTVNMQVPGSYTLTYAAQDAAGNTGSASRVVNVVDGTSPVITVPSGTLEVALTDSLGAYVDYSAEVSISDDVDPAPTLSCSPASGSLFPIGTTNVTCTGTDASGNSATANFDVFVGYGGSYGINPKKLRARSGSSNPMSWAWQDEHGNNIDSSADMQLLSIVKCNDTSMVVLEVAGDPGSSGFHVKIDYVWEFNWQSDWPDTGEGLPTGDYCARVESSLTGQDMTSPPITLH